MVKRKRERKRGLAIYTGPALGVPLTAPAATGPYPCTRPIPYNDPTTHTELPMGSVGQ